MHRIQSALFVCSAHYEVSSIELPLAISKTTTVAFVVHPSSGYHIQLDIGHVSDILQDQPTTSQCCQAYIANADYPTFTIISHLYIAMVPDYVNREALSRQSYMERCTGVNNPGALFTCKICTCLLTNEYDILFTCGYG